MRNAGDVIPKAGIRMDPVISKFLSLRLYDPVPPKIKGEMEQQTGQHSLEPWKMPCFAESSL